MIGLAAMMSVRFPLWLLNVENLLRERGIDISHERVRFGSNTTKGVPIHWSNSMSPSFFNG